MNCDACPNRVHLVNEFLKSEEEDSLDELACQIFRHKPYRISLGCSEEDN